MIQTSLLSTLDTVSGTHISTVNTTNICSENHGCFTLLRRIYLLHPGSDHTVYSNTYGPF